MTKVSVTLQLPPGIVVDDGVRAKLLLGVSKQFGHVCDDDCDHGLEKAEHQKEMRKLPHRAPQEGVDASVKLYERIAGEMLDEIEQVLVGADVVEKAAAGPHGLWTPEQLARVRAVIDRHHAVLALSVFGAGAVPPDLLKDLKAIPNVPSLIDDPFTYGQLLAITRDPTLATKTTSEIADLVAQRRQQLALSPAEKAAVDVAKKHAGQYVVGLASRVAAVVMPAVIGAEENLTPARMVELIQDKTAANLARRETAAKLKSDLGWSMGNWTRDWQRIGMTETNNAIQEGVAVTIEGSHGVDVLVSKIPRPDACPGCKRVYLEGGEPIIFKLSELRKNGSNAGRRQKDWKPVVGATHPWCGCMLTRVVEGARWENGEMVIPTAKSERVVTHTSFVVELHHGPIIDVEPLEKALFIGPRGGKWADAGHTIPWKDSGMVASLRYKDAGVRDLHHAVKAGDEDAIRTMAEQMAPHLPEDAVIVPMPGRSGAGGIGERLAQHLSTMTGRPVVHALAGKDRPSLYEHKKAGGDPAAVDLGFHATGHVGNGTPVIVDNVIGTGTTARAARAAIPGAVVLVHAVDEDAYREPAGLHLDAKGQRWADAAHTVPYSPETHGGRAWFLPHHEEEQKVAASMGFTTTAKPTGFPSLDRAKGKVPTFLLKVSVPAERESDVGAVKLVGRDGTFAIIHRGSKPETAGKWQVSRFDGDGAVGDSVRATLDEAVTAARQDGYRLHSMLTKAEYPRRTPRKRPAT